MLPDPSRVHPVRRDLPHRQRLRLLISTAVRSSQKPRSPSAAGGFCCSCCNATVKRGLRKHQLTLTPPMRHLHGRIPQKWIPVLRQKYAYAKFESGDDRLDKKSFGGSTMLDRREWMKRAGMAALATGLASQRAFALDSVTLPFDNGERPLVRYPQKRPMIGQTERPPQLETPFSIFNDGPITPNNAFFVRYHLADVPYDIDPDKFTLEVKGKVDRPLKLSLKDIRKLKAVELIAVNQCSGNSRGFSNPRVAGGQLANGAMGNARWRGVPLKAVLDMAGVQAGVRQVTFDGMDGPVSDKTPDFVKALDIDHARDGEVMLAYGMNGDDLPVLNGFPLRLVVPGYY